ncbi:MAG TPA: hypothetical protein VF971_00090 [Candidatus Limnocylindrales bacterium]
MGLVVLALLLAACGPAVTPSPEPGPGGVTLVPGTAVSATVGPEGAELTAADPDGGRTYRLTVPAGALAEASEVTVSPIAAIEGLPLGGDLLGGVEIGPDGQSFTFPATLEIRLDDGARARLRSALDAGDIVYGFASDGSGGPATLDLVELAADLSVIRLRLTGASPHGAGVGPPANAAPPRPSDPAKAARHDIHQILYPPGGPADPNDPAVRADIADVLRAWALGAIHPAIAAAADVPAFEDAVRSAIDWYELGRLFGLATGFWYAPGDALEAEGFLLQTAALLTYFKLFDAANEACKVDGDIAAVRRLIELDQTGTTLGLIESNVDAIMAPANFCIKLKISLVDAPMELAEGATATVGFAIESGHPNIALTAYDLAVLQVIGTFTPRFPNFLDIPVDIVAVDGLSSRVTGDVIGRRAMAGRTDEGLVELGVTMLGFTTVYATGTAAIDITSLAPTPAPPITCSGDPATITNSDEEAFIGIRFDGSSTCAVVPNLSDDDDPDAMLALDVDRGESGWDAHDGENWSRESLGSNQASGTYTVRVQHVPSGRSFTLTLTVEVTLVDGGPAVRLSVRDVTITQVAT